MADLSGLPESPTLSQLCLRHTQLSSLLPTLWQQHLPSTFCSKLDRAEDEPQETRTFQRSPFSVFMPEIHRLSLITRKCQGKK